MNDARYGITIENLLRALPSVLQEDAALLALGSAAASQLSSLSEDSQKAVIYAAIDSLPEAVLDLLAIDFKVDWWDPNYSLDEKRRTLISSWNVHRRLGTPWAVETAISAIYQGTQVQEWFEYDGEPYHFKLLIDATYEGTDPVKHRQVLDRVNFYKNLRSVLDSIEYYNKGGVAKAYAVTAFAGSAMVTAQTAINYADMEGVR